MWAPIRYLDPTHGRFNHPIDFEMCGQHNLRNQGVILITELRLMVVKALVGSKTVKYHIIEVIISVHSKIKDIKISN